MDRIRRTRKVVEQPKEEPEELEQVDMEEEENEEEDEALETAEPSTMEDMDRIEARYRERATSPLRAIRAFCVHCMGSQPRMVAKCTAKKCILYPFRFGKNPYQKHKRKRKE